MRRRPLPTGMLEGADGVEVTSHRHAAAAARAAALTYASCSSIVSPVEGICLSVEWRPGKLERRPCPIACQPGDPARPRDACSVHLRRCRYLTTADMVRDAGCHQEPCPCRRGPGLREVRNDFGKPDYGGPCPPKGHGTHHYHSRLLAISRATLDLRPTASTADVLKTAEPYAIRRAELVGTYQR